MQARDRLAERRGGVPIDCGPGEGWQISEAGCTINRRNFGVNAPVIRKYSGEARGIGYRTRERAERIELFFFQAEDGIRDRSRAFLLNRSSDLGNNRQD